jgi:hypothetical protein
MFKDIKPVKELMDSSNNTYSLQNEKNDIVEETFNGVGKDQLQRNIEKEIAGWVL